MSVASIGKVKIIVAGLPRTSTTSLKKGLEILGVGPCFHLGDPPAPIKRVKESAKALSIEDKQARQAALKTLYDGFEAIFEPLASVYVDDLIEIYPDAMVILSVRKDPQAWLRSYYGLDIDLRSPIYRLLGYWVEDLVPHQKLLVYLASEGWDPLCKFLGKDVPLGVDFPRVNEAAFLRRVKQIAMALGSVVWILLLFLTACATVESGILNW